MKKNKKNNLVSIVASALFSVTVSTSALADLITFDEFESALIDSSTALGVVPNGYFGFNWNNLIIFDASKMSDMIVDISSTGYVHGTVSKPLAAFIGIFDNKASFESLLPFQLNSLYLTRSFGDGDDIGLGFAHIEGYAGDKSYSIDVFSLKASAPTLVTFNDWTNLTKVVIYEFNEYPLLGAYIPFVIDNIDVNLAPITLVPEPQTYAMLLVGLSFIIRRINKESQGNYQIC